MLAFPCLVYRNLRSPQIRAGICVKESMIKQTIDVIISLKRPNFNVLKHTGQVSLIT